MVLVLTLHSFTHFKRHYSALKSFKRMSVRPIPIIKIITTFLKYLGVSFLTRTEYSERIYRLSSSS